MKNIFFASIITTITPAFAVENCAGHDSAEQASLETNLSPAKAEHIAVEYMERKGIVVPSSWCKIISVKTDTKNKTWRFFYTGTQLDACFSINVDDKSENPTFESCA